MLLAIDIGNSSISMGLFYGADIAGRLNLSTRPVRTLQAYQNEIAVFLSECRIKLPVYPFCPERESKGMPGAVENPLSGVIISSVVPALTGTLLDSVRGMSMTGVMNVSTSLNTGLDFDFERPDEVGADRIANAVAAKEIYGDPAIVVDFGTATTVSAVKNGRYIGGAILPGLEMIGDCLHRGTAQLPHVDIDFLRDKLTGAPAVGKNTKANIISGIIYGTAGAVERLIAEIEQAERGRFRVVITGGYSSLMARFVKREHYPDADLTLKGLRIIYEKNI